MELAEVVRSGLGGARGTSSGTGGATSLLGVDTPLRVRENDEENQAEESSSTESTHQEVTPPTTHTHEVRSYSVTSSSTSLVIVGFSV